MGSIVEFNDTLQITKEQGFPEELDYEKHKIRTLEAVDFADRVFEFFDKPKGVTLPLMDSDILEEAERYINDTGEIRIPDRIDEE